MIYYRDLLRQILTTLKSRQGCSVEDLVPLLPEQYRYTDYDPAYYILKTLSALVKWGLVEAFENGELLKLNSYEQIGRESTHTARFYISQHAVEMEDALGIKLVGTKSEVFRDVDQTQRSWPDAFVLMPFKAELKPVYEDHIRKVITSMGFEVARADDFFTNGSIMTEIWTAINKARIIIADCTDRNPNVFYEIGIAHTLGKETILITQSLEDIPFDLRHLRVISYTYNPRGMADFEKTLEKVVNSLRDKGA